MSPKSFAVSCGIAVLATLLGMPAQVRAQSLTGSVSRLSSADIHRILKDAPSAMSQPSTAQPRSTSIRTNAVTGAVIGAIAGVATGVLLNLSCANERSSGCWEMPVGFGALGAGIGAGIGAAVGASK